MTGLPSVTELEANFARVSDPSPHFLDQACQVDDLPSVKLPGWLVNAKPAERFDYHAALLDLAASQGQFKGTTSLGDIDSISRYASRRLREQLQVAYQGKATCNPDALLISISERLEGSSPTAPQSLFLREETLTELAISRLGSSEVATRISNADGTPYKGELTLEDIESLILKADIGGSYPKYVNDKVNTQPRRAARISQFAREWRSQLRFSTLKAACEGQLDEATRKALLDACSPADDKALGHASPRWPFSAHRGKTADRAHGMYLIELPGRIGWLLYRPFYENNTLLQFATLEALMVALRSKGELQQSVLDWLGNDVRAVYENDGFIRPHLHPGLSNIAHLLGVDSALVDTVLDTLKRPVTIEFAAWDDDLDRHLFDARVEAMLQAASRNSVSNAQEKWALVKQAAWALFNTLTLFWHGPSPVLCGWCWRSRQPRMMCRHWPTARTKTVSWRSPTCLPTWPCSSRMAQRALLCPRSNRRHRCVSRNRPSGYSTRRRPASRPQSVTGRPLMPLLGPGMPMPAAGAPTSGWATCRRSDARHWPGCRPGSRSLA